LVFFFVFYVAAQLAAAGKTLLVTLDSIRCGTKRQTRCTSFLFALWVATGCHPATALDKGPVSDRGDWNELSSPPHRVATLWEPRDTARESGRLRPRRTGTV